MIASIHGIINYKSPELRKDSYFIIEAAGVGYKVFTPVNNLQKIELASELTVFTYFSVSEYALDLYGFLDPADKTFFSLLLDVPGIGPKSAIGVMDKTTMAEVQQAILSNDPEFLITKAGLGEKTAEKIILALKDKVESLTVRSGDKKSIKQYSADADAFAALVSLGYSAAEARKALNQITDKSVDSGNLIKQALKFLGRK